MRSGAWSRTPLLAKDGYADLFCLSDAPSTDVSTRREPVGGRVNWKPPLLGVASVGVGALFCCSRLEMRARRDTDPSLGSLLVLRERARPSCAVGGGGIASPLGPDGGSSVWIKQHRFPYGQEPETQKVCEYYSISRRKK
jgi:hypothetical protein